MDQLYDVIIIGGGAAATSAAMTLKNRGKSIAVVANKAETGSLYKAVKISNYPGLPPMSGAEMTELLRPGDLMIITADHGCDPCDISTDHTRENIPILAYTPGMTKSVDLGMRSTFADIAATCADWLGLPDRFGAESFADALR